MAGDGVIGDPEVCLNFYFSYSGIDHASRERAERGGVTWAYYNEFEPYAAQWLRNLIAAGLIPDGEVDERDIREVAADDVQGFAQVHLFAGIGGWSLALERAGWDGPVWTGSCPCQPLSSAGQRKGHADERHLWPAFHALIAERRPATVFGEQVASKLGREWLAGLRADLEDLGYAVGAADLPAAGVGAPHIRQRLWWVADRLAQPHGRHASTEGLQRGGEHGQQPEDGGAVGGLGDVASGRFQEPPKPDCESSKDSADRHTFGADIDGSGFWSDFDTVPCGDGKARRVEPGTFPLAHGIPNRVGKLRAYGNAITPQAAAEFIRAIMQADRKVA